MSRLVLFRAGLGIYAKGASDICLTALSVWLRHFVVVGVARLIYERPRTREAHGGSRGLIEEIKLISRPSVVLKVEDVIEYLHPFLFESSCEVRMQPSSLELRKHDRALKPSFLAMSFLYLQYMSPLGSFFNHAGTKYSSVLQKMSLLHDRIGFLI